MRLDQGGGRVPRKVSLRVRDVDLQDEAVIVQIARYLDDLSWSVVDGRTSVDIYAESTDLVSKAIEVAHRIQTCIPGACVDQVDDGLVGIPDIAALTKLNRETIRAWTNGTRGPGGFPVPVGSLGGGERGSTKVWRWREVNIWLDDNYSLGDPFSYPTEAEVTDINSQLSQLHRLLEKPHYNGLASAGALNLSQTLSTSGAPDMRVVGLPQTSVLDQRNVMMGAS